MQPQLTPIEREITITLTANAAGLTTEQLFKRTDLADTMGDLHDALRPMLHAGYLVKAHGRIQLNEEARAAA